AGGDPQVQVSWRYGGVQYSGPDRAIADSSKAPPGGDRGQSQGCLGQAETIADALAGAGAERDKGAAVGPGRLPSAGIEAVWVRVQIAAVVNEVGTVRQGGSRGEAGAA